MNPSLLAAIRVDRRAVAIALFNGAQLDYTQTRQLPGGIGKAETSLTAFLNWVLATFAVEGAAIETVSGAENIQRARLARVAIEAIRNASVPIWEIPKDELLSSFGHPGLQSRKGLREIISRIWPILNTRGNTHWILDAVALGLYVQVERLFHHH